MQRETIEWDWDWEMFPEFVRWMDAMKKRPSVLGNVAWDPG